MGIMTQLFGKEKASATQAERGITPVVVPKKMAALRTAPEVEQSRYFTEQEANSLKALSKQKTEGARHSVRAYGHLAKIEEADTKVHRAHRRYQVAVVENGITRAKSDARLERKLHQARPEFERLSQGVDRARAAADQRIADLRGKLK